MLHQIDVDQKETLFTLVHGHVGIWRNEAADMSAKETLDKEPTDDTDDLIPFS